MKITLQALVEGDGENNHSSFKDQRKFEIELTRKRASELLDKCEVLFNLPEDNQKESV